MSKKFTRLMAILLSLNLTFSTGTFAAFAAEAEDGSTDTGYSESGDPAASAPKAEDSGTESTPDTSSPAPTESTGENAEPSVPSEPSAPGESASPSTSEAPTEAAPSAPAEKAPRLRFRQRRSLLKKNLPSRHRLRRMQSPRLRRTASGMMFPRAMPLLPAAQTA